MKSFHDGMVAKWINLKSSKKFVLWLTNQWKLKWNYKFDSVLYSFIKHHIRCIWAFSNLIKLLYVEHFKPLQIISNFRSQLNLADILLTSIWLLNFFHSKNFSIAYHKLHLPAISLKYPANTMANSLASLSSMQNVINLSGAMNTETEFDMSSSFVTMTRDNSSIVHIDCGCLNKSL